MDSIRFLLVFSVIISSILPVHCTEIRRFPNDFKFGIATAAHQIEGAWNISDKSTSIWDYATHNTSFVIDGGTGDIACDSYHNYKRDVQMLVELGVDFYRFSISWTRVLPTGFANYISEDGLKYYNNLINELLIYNITPVVTLYHWDLPQRLQDLGGWANPLMADYYLYYAEVVFNAFGDRVKLWLTFNEPWALCLHGYGEEHMAPALNMAGIGEYLCAHTILKAHANVYHLYDRFYRSVQRGKITIALNSAWHQPENNTKEAKELAEMGMQFELGWFANPIFSKKGDYPKIMRDRISRKSSNQGYPYSRLPRFTKGEIKRIRGTYDFFGFNHYTTAISLKRNSNIREQSYNSDVGSKNYQEEIWKGSGTEWLKVVPWGFRKSLNWIKDSYGNPEVVIFENGFSDKGELRDNGRIEYHNAYLNALLDAIEDGCHVTGYTAWSFMDNFEWFQGYTEKFGFYSVDFNDPKRKRTPKASATYYKNVIKNRSIRKKAFNGINVAN